MFELQTCARTLSEQKIELDKEVRYENIVFFCKTCVLKNCTLLKMLQINVCEEAWLNVYCSVDPLKTPAHDQEFNISANDERALGSLMCHLLYGPSIRNDQQVKAQQRIDRRTHVIYGLAYKCSLSVL